MSLDLDKIRKELEPLFNYSKTAQVCLQGTHDNLDPFLGCRKFNDITFQYAFSPYIETDFVKPIFNIPYLNSIMEDLKMFRTRIMTLKPGRCYHYHRDYTKRIHIPIETNKNCFIIDNMQVKHLSADGNYYIVDTTKMHTALNGSKKENRTHIVGGINAT